MEDRGLSFSAEFVPKVLDGSKTVTRRPMKPQPKEQEMRWTGRHWEQYLGYPLGHDVPVGKYGFDGDRFYIKETWRTEELESGLDGVRFKADNAFEPIENSQAAGEAWYVANDETTKWRPPQFMPEWAARPQRWEIVSVRPEQLQRDISVLDINREGVEYEPYFVQSAPANLAPRLSNFEAAMDAFQKLWDSIYTKRGYPWENNPWVWRIEWNPKPTETTP